MRWIVIFSERRRWFPCPPCAGISLKQYGSNHNDDTMTHTPMLDRAQYCGIVWVEVAPAPGFSLLVAASCWDVAATSD